MTSQASSPSRRRLGTLRTLLSAAALALATTACLPAPEARAADVLRIGISQPIDSLNPFVSSSDYSSIAFQYGYPFLTVYDA
ncbi:hypothetical protein NL432_26305, partial [Klebsiella pneumoniae]|nr:hypothetical protein [Klebsiella pneumoniae]